MGERDGKQPTPMTNGHRPASDAPSTPASQPSVGLPGAVKPKGTPKAAGNRLPPPTRSRVRLIMPPRAAQGSNTRRADDLDEAMLHDGTRVLSPPPPPERFEPRRRREPERTQIVIPLPPPELDSRVRMSSPTDPLAQTAGEIVCGRGRANRRMPRAAIVVEGGRRRGIALGLAVGIAAIAGAALGVSAISSSGLPRNAPVPVQVERAARVEEAPPAPRRPVVEELPVAARELEAAPVAPPVARDDAPRPRVERPPVARPLRQRTIAPTASIGRHKTAQPVRANKQARSRALTYDPDALFLKRP
jgi:hypothetical protein